MFNSKNISPIADFYSELKPIRLQLEIINKNILYISHESDKIKKIVTQLVVDKGLQQQVDEYFEDAPPEPPSKDDLD